MPGLIESSKRLPDLITSGLSTLTLFNNLPYSLGLVLESNAIKFKNRPAIFFEDKSLTYNELNQLVNQFANYFVSIGIKKGQVAILFLENRPEILIITAALAKIGAIASLINSQISGVVLEHCIQIKQDGYFFIGEELVSVFDEIKPKIQTNSDKFIWVKDKGTHDLPVDYIDLYGKIESFPTNNPSITKSIRVKDAFAFIFTSGTTGMPKASIQTHKRWLSAMNWFGKISGNFNENDVIYISIPFFHSNALIIGWSCAFASGGALAIRRKFSVSAFWVDIQKYNATSFIYIGEICRYLLNAPITDLDKSHKVIKILGNGMRPEIWDDFKNRFNIQNIYEFYGASESNIIFTNTLNLNHTVGWSPVSFAIIKYDIEHDEPLKDNKGQFQKVSVGETGLMISKITTSFPFAGYVDSKHNNEKIFNNVFSKGDQWFNTGDLMRDIGFKHTQFVDRIGDTFRWKGENVATAEVEAIINAMDFVESCTVYGVQIPNCDGRAGMCAIIPKNKTGDFDVNQLYKLVSNQLPAYAIPVFIREVTEFEVTATQKIKKSNLKKESFDCLDSDNKIWVKLSNQNEYTSLNVTILSQIKSGKLTF